LAKRFKGGMPNFVGEGENFHKEGDTTSAFLTALKCNKFVFGRGSPDPVAAWAAPGFLR